MHKTILDLLEINKDKYAKKIVFKENNNEINYEDFVLNSKLIGTNIGNLNVFNEPIAIFIDKSINCLLTLFGILYSGNFYTIIDTNMPKDRIETILNNLNPTMILTDNKNLDKINSYNFNYKLINIEDLSDKFCNDELLKEISLKVIDTNPMYILFTSGSTGVPKGTVINHKALLSYIKWFADTFEINDATIFGSQTPFYFSMSVSDIFATIYSGATFVIIQKMYFSFPVKLLNYLNDEKINTIYWVPSALGIVASLKALDEIKPLYLQKVLFAGEVMPTKNLNIWRKALPNALFANLFGPTETTDICTFYIVNRNFKDDEPLPIGNACNNCDAFIVNDLGEASEEGELLVRGSFLANGYYNAQEKTNEVFIQNPLNKSYPEIVYRTGDIVKYNEFGELMYLSRKDFQIKHMGYRIELGEIETAINAIEGIVLCATIYKDEKIVLYYTGDIKDDEIINFSRLKLPNYMIPNVLIKLNKMPYNANGKIDRVYLKENYNG